MESKKNLEQPSEARQDSAGLTPFEVSEGTKLKDWEYGYLKYLILEDALRVTSIYVYQTHREQGNGSKILKFAERLAKELGKGVVKIASTSKPGKQVFGTFLKEMKYKQVTHGEWEKKINI